MSAENNVIFRKNSSIISLEKVTKQSILLKFKLNYLKYKNSFLKIISITTKKPQEILRLII